MENRIFKGTLSSILLGVSAFTTGSAWADLGVINLIEVQTNPLPNTVQIYSDGSVYTGPMGTGGIVKGIVDIELDAQISGKIKSWSAWLATRTTTGSWHIHDSESIGESYPVGSRPKTLSTSRAIEIDFSTIGTMHCNYMADFMRSNGHTNEEIFQQDWVIEITPDARLSYEMSGITGGDPVTEAPEWFTFNLVCKATEPEEPGNHTPIVDDYGPVEKAHIFYANLVLDYIDTPTECPTEVTATALYVSDTPGTFKTRFQNVFGKVSKTVVMTMGPDDLKGGHYSKLVQRTFTVGAEDEPPVVGPGVGGASDEFSVETQNDSPIDGGLNGNPPAKPDLGYVDLPDDPNIHHDSLWVDVMDAGFGSVTGSKHKQYTIHCTNFFDPDQKLELDFDGHR